jgi:uncharacterized membrane protein
MINKNSIRTLAGTHHHFIIPLSGISLGLFIWSMYFSALSPVFCVFVVICLLYVSLFISSFTISCLSGLKMRDVLKKDTYTYLPLLLFLFFLIKYSLSTSTPLYDYMVERYFSGVLIIPIGSMMIFLKILLFANQINFPSNLFLLQKNRVYYLLSSLAVVYVSMLSYYSIIRHINLNSGIDCLGFYSQVVWLFSNLEVPFSSFQGRNIFADHMTPILIFFSPFYKIYSDPVILLVLQSVLLSSGVFPIYWLAKDKLDSNYLTISLCIGYLLYPALQFANLYEFHPVNIATPLLLFIFYFLHKRLYFRYYIFLILTLLCREDVVPIIFFLGIYIFFYEKKRKIGVITTLLSVSWFYFAYWIFLPYITSGEYSKLDTGSFGLYSHLGSSLGEILSTIVFHPVFILKKILIIEKLGYIVLLILPLCFLSLFHPPTFLIGFSMIMGNMLSRGSYMSTIRLFYTATITPLIFISCIYALQFLLYKQNFIMNFVKKVYPIRTISRSGLVFAFSSVILFASITSSILYGPLPYSSDPYAAEFLVMKEGVDSAKEMFKLIPPNASISASNNLGAHLSIRKNAYTFPYPPQKEPEYVMVNLAKPYRRSKSVSREEFNKSLREFLFQRNFGVLHSKEGYTLFKKDYKDKLGIKKIAFATDSPDQIVNIKMNNDIIFWGYTLNTSTIRPKMPFRIFYFWKVSEETDDNYYILIKLVDKNGKIVFEQDHEPVYGLYPTSSWGKEESISEVYWIELPITVNPGTYQIYVGVSEKASGNDKLENLIKAGIITVQKF